MKRYNKITSHFIIILELLANNFRIIVKRYSYNVISDYP